MPIARRIEDLLSRMTLEEKFWQLYMIPGDLSDDKERYANGIFGFQVAASGTQADAAGQRLEYGRSGTAAAVASRINGIQKYFVEETRLGIPIIPFDEALHGLVRDGATAFPQAIALAATWDPKLVGDVARAIARETRSRGIRQVLSPVLNIARDVRWGRVEETYGEAPWLTTQMGLAFVSACEDNGVIATPKHFVANVGDGGRDSYPIHFDRRLMEEIYFPAFRAAIQQGGARSIMTAYNSWDGTPATSNSFLLRDTLREAWGFEGFVVSDAGATGGANVLHGTSLDYTEATQAALTGGLDVIFQTSYDHHGLFWKAFEEGRIPTPIIDDAVRRVLRAKFGLGLFEEPYVPTEQATRWNGHPDHRALARRAAASSVVLLENRHRTLPLSASRIALIGTDATETRLGGYSGPGNRPISILEGLRRRIGEDGVIYRPGPGRGTRPYAVLDGRHLETTVDGKVVPGLEGHYFDNIRMEGHPKLSRIDTRMQFGWTLYSPHPSIPEGWYSVRWRGRLIGPSTGKVRLGIEGDDGYRLYLSGKCILDNWKKQSHGRRLVEVDLEEGKRYDLELEFFESRGTARLGLVWDQGVKDATDGEIARAVEAAGRCDVAVIVAGIEEGEFQDRARLSLPGKQEQLIHAVAATGKPVVVVLIGGSAITMRRWIDEVDAVLMAWYPGEAGGQAIADVLSGDANPAGRLPITFPMEVGQVPLFYNHKPTGRGDDYRDLTGQPLFAFGHGLSYTTFEYSDLTLSEPRIPSTGSVRVACRVRNAGAVAGDEVVQLYLHDELASVARPIMQLRGFQRLRLAPGESRSVTFTLASRHLRMLDRNLQWCVEPGRFCVMVGASSRDIRLRGHFEVR